MSEPSRDAGGYPLEEPVISSSENPAERPRTLASRAELSGAPMSSTLGFDTPCKRCGYNLRGLALNAVCPECATIVERSLRGDLLYLSEPSYVRRLRRGASLVAWGVLGTWLAGPVLGLLAGVLAAASGGASFFLVLPIVMFVVVVACPAVMLAGWWFLSTPDPGRLAMRQSMTLHGLVRLSAGGLILAQVFFALAIWSPFVIATTSPPSSSQGHSLLTHGPSVQPYSPLVGSLIGLGSFLGWIIALVAWPTLFFAGLLLVRRMARRIPNPRVARLALWLMWSPLVAAACVAMSVLLPLVGGLIALVGLFSLAVFYIGLFVRLSSGLRRIERAQRRTGGFTAAAPTSSA